MPLPSFYASASAFLGGFADDYLVLDTETTGLEPRSPSTLVAEVGWVAVRGRAPASWGSLVLDWRGHPAHGPGYLAALDAVGARMAAKSLNHGVPPDRVRAEGVPPEAAVVALLPLVEDAAAAGMPVVGHNFWAFDRVLLEALFRGCGRPRRFDPARVWDTGLFEKARLLRYPVPPPGSLPACRWYDRIAADARSVRCGLSTACDKTYALGVDRALAHGALYDCQINHRLYEALRRAAEGGAGATA